MDTQNIAQSTQSSSSEQAEDLIQQEPASYNEGQEEGMEEGDFVQRAKNELLRISSELKEISSNKQERTKREEKVHKSEEKSPPVQTFAAEAEPEVVDVKPFMLVEDGHTLSLPSKYRKIKSVNTKLVSQIHKKKHETDFIQSERFTSRLENQFDWQNQLDRSNQLSHETLATEAQSLMESQHKLLLHAAWVIDRSGVINTSSAFSWQNVYKCYRHWQVLLGKFRDVQKQARNLMAGQYKMEYVLI